MISLLDRFSPARIPEEAECLRSQVKAFVAEHLGDRSADVRARSWSGFDASFSRALAAEGWVGITLPERYGGGGRDAFSRYVLVEELLAAGAPVAAHWIGDRQSGPLLLHYGTEEQRQYYLPRMCRGEIFFCIGMSEPSAGSDLASVRTRAIPHEDGFLLNGSKIWTTYAHKSHYMIALLRTSGGLEDRQKGLSQFIIDLSLPGIEVRPIVDITGESHFNEVFFTDVKLTKDALIGTEGDGWAQVNAELAFERSGPERIYSSIVLLDRWIKHLQQLSGHEANAARVGRFMGYMAVLRQMSISITARLVAGDMPVTEAALIKDIGTELEQEIPVVVSQALAENPEIPAEPDLLRTLAFVAQVSPSYSLRGGTREILRGMVARGLGLR
ncbi:acyl-CoA dehydrogenase family protein [Sphingobium sp. 3R8]|uniref:acyl-CoA dehydrogenase family protein n=1 Tax=Sphingobium sp. 3R8 TaxID=2874921 RepID=UPI001CC9507E|nr:acyl-CoA dehydrogenase family protein [Sphingobium sp. 3R8]MBZ9650343.1 acyl-CoA dehydrogenase family protein [Sphingobium sp. 3R8]